MTVGLFPLFHCCCRFEILHGLTSGIAVAAGVQWSQLYRCLGENLVSEHPLADDGRQLQMEILAMVHGGIGSIVRMVNNLLDALDLLLGVNGLVVE